VVPNAFSHANKRFDQVVAAMSQKYRASLGLEVGMPEPSRHINCRQLSFQRFCQIPFPGEVPQFIQTLFECLTGEDLRKLVYPIAKDNLVSL